MIVAFMNDSLKCSLLSVAIYFTASLHVIWICVEQIRAILCVL